MSIQKNTFLRHQSEGYVRFELPEELCRASVAPVFKAELHNVEGVYRVFLYRHQKKLSIRYLETLCDFPTLVKQIAGVIGTLEEQNVFTRPAPSNPKRRLVDKIKGRQPVSWLSKKLTSGKETVAATGVLIKSAASKGKPRGFLKDPESTAIDFLNDVLVLYLIKRHWHLITQHWLKQPIQYRYDWMAAFYMIFLLVRSRRPKPKIQLDK